MKTLSFFTLLAGGLLCIAPGSVKCDQKIDELKGDRDNNGKLENVLRKQFATLLKQDQAIKSCEKTLQRFEEERQKWQTMADQLESLKEKFDQEATAWRKEKLEWQKEKRELISLFTNNVLKAAKSDKVNHKYDDRLDAVDRSHDIFPTSEDEVRKLYYLTSRFDDEDHTSHGVAVRGDDLDPLGPVLAQVQQRLTEVSAEVQAMKNENLQRDILWQGSHGSVFTRWGRSVCPNFTETVYSGVVGGSYSSTPGSAAEYLCLTLSPVLTDPHPHTDYAMLTGSEYQTGDLHTNHDPLCAVCRSPRATTLMLPATNVCHPGWILEYSGYLMAGKPTQASPSEYVCVDADYEDRAGSQANLNGKLLYYTQAHCGSLPCPPYSSMKVITCAVCSK